MPSFSCGQCSACKYRTKKPKTDCKFGSTCTLKDCMYAHASPAGTQHMAGSITTACRSGILCSAGGCKFAHPSKSLVCTAKFEAPAVLLLSGSLQHNEECLGEYTLTERKAYGGAVWKHGSEDLWIARHSDGEWSVQAEEDVGKGCASCLLLSDAAALMPHLSSKTWEEGDGKKWLTAPSLKCEANGSGSAPAPPAGAPKLIDHIVDKLKKSPTDYIMASVFGGEIRKNRDWSDEIDDAGGLKGFCLDHDDTIVWVPDGTGKIKLLKEASFPLGAKVTIAVEKPSCGWGAARAWSVGIVRSFTGTRYTIDFPEAKGWKGEESDLALSSGADRSTQDIGEADPAFDKFGFVRNKGAGKFEFSGAANRHTERGLWEHGFVHGAQQLTPSKPYFELTIVKACEDGIGIGLAGELFFAGGMVGWDEGWDNSMGLHSGDGKLYYKADGKGVSLADPASEGDTLGCGVLFESGKPKAVYFCRNRTVIGRFPVRSEDADTLFPVVTSASPAVVQVNLAAPAPAVAMACVLHPRAVEFPSLEHAFQAAADGDTVEVKDCGVHLMRDSIDFKKDITVRGPADASAKPVISRGGGAVFNIHAKVSLEKIAVKSVGGSSKPVADGGAVGIRFVAGELSMAACHVQSEKGSAIVSDGIEETHRFFMERCTIGPCDRFGVGVVLCPQDTMFKEVEICDIGMRGINIFGGNAIFSRCVIRACNDFGIVFGAWSDKASGAVTMHNCCITSCKGTAVAAVAHADGGERADDNDGRLQDPRVQASRTSRGFAC